MVTKGKKTAVPLLGGITEIAEMANRPRPVVCNWADRGTKGFPAPLANLAAGRVWDLDEVGAWLRAHPEMEGEQA